MNSSQIREPVSFGKRREPHTITITRNGRSRMFKINPIISTMIVGVMFMFMVGYFSATAYLVFRDDLIGASYAKRARMQHEYEDRIAALRARLDRVTSRQLLDQQAIETKVQELLARQARLGERGTKMEGLMERARSRGLTVGTARIPVPVARPKTAEPAPDPVKTGSIIDPDTNQQLAAADLFSLRSSKGLANLSEEPATITTAFAGSKFTPEELAKTAAELDQNLQIANAAAAFRPISSEYKTSLSTSIFGEVADAIGSIDVIQRQEVDSLRLAAAQRTKKIASTLNRIGVPIPAPVKTQVGGPFIPLDPAGDFEEHLEALDDSLAMLDTLTNTAKRLPLSSPLKGHAVSSRYGRRVDPFNGRMAMHSGIDFKAPTGTSVRASGGGIVKEAGRKGGYGNVVEIVHRNGYTTRYAHLSRIHVKPGQRIERGQKIGRVGSTGRSTGPHLHYEIRKGGKAINPSRFLEAGKAISKLL